MELGLFLNSLLELYLSFGSEFLYNNLNPISILVLSLILLFISFVGIPNFRENEQTHKHRVRAKRRRKGGTRQGLRYHSKDNDRELISFLKSTLGQNYDTTRCRQLLCPDPSCEVCNNAAAEINRMLFSEALEKSTPSVTSVASSASVTAQVTEPSFHQSSVFSAVPLGELFPTSLPEPAPQPPSVLSYNPMTTLGHFQSPSPLGQTLPPEPRHHILSETEHLQCNGLLKGQESLWGLTSVVQRSKAHVTNSIDPVEFPLSSEFLEKFEHHLRKRLMQHHKGQPCRIHGPLSLMRPLSNCSGILESKSTSGLSWISMEKDQSSENPNVGLSQPGIVYDRSSESSQIEDNEGKEEGHSQENDPKVFFLSESKPSSHKDVGSGSEVTSLSRENVQKVHFLRKKFEKISEGQLPGTVHSSQHSFKQNPVKSHTELEKRTLPSSVGGDYCLNTSQELTSLECGAQQMRKPHITMWQMGMLSALPTKVLESNEPFKSKHTSSNWTIIPHSSSSTKLIFETNTKSGAFMPLRGHSGSLHQDKVETENSADGLNFPLLTTSLGDKKGHSPAAIQQTLSEEMQKFLKIKLPVPNTISGGESHSLRANTQPPKLPARRAGTPQETKKNRGNSKDTIREKSQPAPSMSREIVRAERLQALQPQTCGILTTSKPGISQRINTQTVVTTENPPPKLSVQDPNLSGLKTQIMAEFKLKLETKYSEAQGQSTDMSHDSDSSTCKASLTPAQDVSSGDEEVPQLLHVHSEDSTVSVEKQQEPWLPRQASRSCQDQNFPPAVNNDIVRPPPEPTGPHSVELGAGDAQMRISRPGGQRFPGQDAASEDKLGSKPSHSLTQKGQATSLLGKEDSHFIGRLKNFFQRMQPGIIQKMQEALLGTGIPLSFTQSRGPVQSRAAFPRTAHAMSDLGKFPEEKRGRRPAVVTTCPQETLPPAAQSGKPVQKGAVQAQAEPVQRRHFLRRPPSYDVTNALSGSQSAILAGQGSTSNEDRTPPKVVASKGPQICQKHPQSVPLRGTLPHPSPSCRPQAAKGPPAVLTTAGGAACRDQPPRFRHTMLPQDFQGQTFPTPK